MQIPLVVVGLLMWILAWQVPGHFPPWTSFQQQWLAAFGGCWITLAAVWSRTDWRWNWPSLALLCLAIVPWLQWGAGQMPFLSDAALPSFYIAGAGLCVAAASNLAAQYRERWADWLMGSLLIASAFAVLLGLAQWLRMPISELWLDPIPPGGRPYGNLSQPNHLATLIALGLAAALFGHERQWFRGWALAMVCLWLGLGLVMTQSRTGWLFVALLAAWATAGHRRLRISLWASGLAVALFVVATWAWSPLNEILLLEGPKASLAARADTETRLGVWKALALAIGDAPWLGWGWNQVPVAQISVAFEQDAGHRAFRNAHNLFLDLAIWVGVPLSLALTAGASYWIWRQIRRCSDGPRWTMLLAIGAIGAHAMTEYPLDYGYFLMGLALLVGTLEGLGPVATTWRIPRASFVAPWAACAAMLFWTGHEYMKVEQSTRDVRLLLFGIGIDKVPYVPPPDTHLLDAWREYHRFMITPATRNMSEAQLQWVRDVAQRHPHPSTLVRYALAMGLNGRQEESKRVVRAICNLHAPISCQRARTLWQSAQDQYPELVAIRMP
jgi:O-antigen ligase